MVTLCVSVFCIGLRLRYRRTTPHPVAVDRSVYTAQSYRFQNAIAAELATVNASRRLSLSLLHYDSLCSLPHATINPSCSECHLHSAVAIKARKKG